jgi:excisionase family DNA binding protein
VVEFQQRRPESEPPMEAQQVYTLHEVAELLKMHVETIRRAVRAGELKAAAPGVGQRGKGADLRVSRIELARWWRSRGGGDLFADTTGEEGGGKPC